MQLITRKQAAERAAISLRHLERLIAVGEGPAVIRLGGRRVGIAEADLAAWLNSRRRPAPGEAA
jgi:excisionase family DNA binding protein